MQLNLTKEQLKVLLDLVYTGNLVINGNRSKEERILPYAEMEQQIFKLASENGYEDLIEYSEEFEEYMPTHSYEYSEINEYVDQYDEVVFWDELVVRFARRDALNILGDENPDMTKEELKALQLKLEDEYDEEVEYHGIERLKVIEVEHKAPK